MKRHVLFIMMLSAMMVLIMGAPAFANEAGEKAAPIEKISYESTLEYYENAGGVLSEDESYYIYNGVEPKYGDRLFVTCTGDKVATEYVMKRGEGDEDMFLSAEGDQIYVDSTSEVDFPGPRLTMTSDQAKDHWKVGSDNYVTVNYRGATCKAKVTVLPNPVKEIEFLPSEKYSVLEDSADEDGIYDIQNQAAFEFWYDDQIKVTYADKDKGTAIFTYTYNEEDADIPFWKDEKGNIIKAGEIKIASDQDKAKWTLTDPDSCYVYVTYLGHESQHMPVTIKKDIDKAEVTLKKTEFAYTGKTIKPPKVKKVTYDGKKLKEGVDYEITTPDEEYFWVGECSICIDGLGEYGGSTEAEYSILPKGTELKAVTSAKKALNLKWKKQTGKMQTWRSGAKAKNIAGYEIQVSTSKDFTEETTETFKVRGFNKTTYQVKNLKAGKKYYVQVRTYIDSGEWKMTSAWSKAISARTR